MREYRVTNRTQGRLEIKEVRKVLDAGESAVIAEPLPESVRFMMGGGKARKVDIAEIVKAPAKQAPKAPVAAAVAVEAPRPQEAKPAEGEASEPRHTKKRP